MRPAGIPKKSVILPRRIFVVLWVLHKLVFTCVGGGISLTFHLLAQALTVERTVIGRPPSQCCQMHDHYPTKTIILSIWYDTSPFPIFQHRKSTRLNSSHT